MTTVPSDPGRRLRRKRWAPPVLLAILVVAVGMASPGEAQPGRQAKATSARPGIPPVPDIGTDESINFDPITPSVSKAKIQFSLHDLTLRTTLIECLKGVGFAYPDPCPIYNTSKLKLAPGDDSSFWLAALAEAWVVSSPGPNPTYGTFPSVRVHALAFGSIPVSATVHLTQTVHHGLYDPITFSLVTYGIAAYPPYVVYPGYGPAPNYGTNPDGTQDGAFFELPLSLSGALNVRLSDVEVDEVPVRVGRTCSTVTPARLKVLIPGGYYPVSASVADLPRDTPGSFAPVASNTDADGRAAPAGWFDGTVDIPRFSGCHDGAEDLDPLFTALISGPGNPISAYGNHGLDLWCNQPLAHCPAAAAAEQSAAMSLAQSVHEHRSTAQLRRAAAALRRLQVAAASARITGPSVTR